MEHNWKHWLQYQGLDWIVTLERDVHRLREDLAFKAIVKRVYVVNHYSCCAYVNNQAKFNEKN